MAKTTQKTTTIQTDYSTATTTTKVTDNNAIGKLYNGPFGIEYTGARYVPIFADPIEWNSQTSYEPLVVVTYQGNSYISRCYVPIGIEITDTHYWAKVADWNAQVEAYRKAVEDYKNDVDNKLPQIEEAKNNAIDAIEKATGEYVDVPEDIKELQDLVQGTMIVIGDSFTQIQHDTRDNWDKIVARSLNLSLKTGLMSSMGYTTSTSFKDLLTNVQVDDVNDVKYIITYGGINDWDKTSDVIYNAASEYIQYAKNRFPKARIMIVGSQHGKDPLDTQDRAYKICQALYKASMYNGVSYTNPTTWLATIDEAKDTDGFHPSTLGHKVIASYMLSAIAGITPDYYRDLKFRRSDQLTSDDEMNVWVSMNKDTLSISLRGVLEANKQNYKRLFFIDNFPLTYQTIKFPIYGRYCWQEGQFRPAFAGIGEITSYSSGVYVVRIIPDYKFVRSESEANVGDCIQLETNFTIALNNISMLSGKQ